MHRHVIPAASLAMSSSLIFQCTSGPVTCRNASRVNPRQLAADSRAARRTLYATNSTARLIGPRAKGILVFPKITKGQMVGGGMAGNGSLIRANESIRDFYQTAGLSYWLQAGLQEYGYALLLMDNPAFWPSKTVSPGYFPRRVKEGIPAIASFRSRMHRGGGKFTHFIKTNRQA